MFIHTPRAGNEDEVAEPHYPHLRQLHSLAHHPSPMSSTFEDDEGREEFGPARAGDDDDDDDGWRSI